MKKLKQFLTFNWPAFAEGKEFEVTNVKPWLDYENKKEVLGTVVETAIIVDNTDYDTEPGEQVTNRYQSVPFKIAKTSVSVKVGDHVEPIGVTATVYGDFSDKLSAKATDIIVVD